jgi:hypothetical protein
MIPKFASEVTAMVCELRKRETSLVAIAGYNTALTKPELRQLT